MRVMPQNDFEFLIKIFHDCKVINNCIMKISYYKNTSQSELLDIISYSFLFPKALTLREWIMRLKLFRVL